VSAIPPDLPLASNNGDLASNTLALLDEIVLKDGHLELEGTVVVFIIDEQHADELLSDIDLSGIIFLRPRHHADFGIAKQTLEIGVELPDFLNVHDSLQ
jgi:hypothetical protein